MRELYRLLTSNDYMDSEEITSINHILINAIHCDILPIEENGRYLRVTDADDADKIDVALWYRHKDEDGNISVKEITKDKEEILKVLHEVYLEKKEEKGRKL